MSHACHRFWKCYQNPHVLLTFDKGAQSLRTRQFFALLTWKCASRHNSVHSCDISTSKSAPKLRCFRHLNFKKCSEREVFFSFFNLRHVLRTTTACTFSTSQLQKVLRTWGAFSFSFGHVLRATTTCNFFHLIWPAGSAPAALASLLFRPSGATNHWKNTVFRDSLSFSRTWIFFLLRLSLFFDLLSSSLLFSDSSHLCVSSVHIVGSLTSKLPSTMM